MSYIPAHKLDAVFKQLVDEINGEFSSESETESEGRFYQYLYYFLMLEACSFHVFSKRFVAMQPCLHNIMIQNDFVFS